MAGRLASVDGGGQARPGLSAPPPSAAPRLVAAVQDILEHAYAVIDGLSPTEAEFDAFVQFLTDVGDATDARRQEWVLLADVLGLSAHVHRRQAGPAPGATPSALRGPFWRPDAPRLEAGANLSRDGRGVPVAVRLTLTDGQGRPVPGAEVDVWHANASGRYENQDPDTQPEFNLRGRFRADPQGRLAFRTIRPAGYRLPDDGPVGRLAVRLGLSLDRPAHIHFAVAAPGFRRLVTAIFDAQDPGIGRDALWSVHPELLGTFRQVDDSLTLEVALVLTRDAPDPKG